ncbi:DUF4262 domain-containing protein [Thermomonospora cellulosilytica]|uniref:DUF4262 domain-containing protein n=1 Tax=Thermomonospora cellulosilytica TaxID=1411118 RepID=A0A7W3R9D6_9ACTN|nr:DUF4262 domain-containing protein [Thermomonospora cellulosilytica]MBA9004637.1 hypothetical protein [Thermomonospora cellulosilytica]
MGSACRCIICHDYGDRDRLGTFELRTIVHVQQYGWSTVLTGPRDGRPGWAFTIGLWHTHRSPELVVFGLDPYDMQTIVNNLGERAAQGATPAPGQERHDATERHPVALRPVDTRWYERLVPEAVRFYRSSPLPFLQVVWPDAAGLYPWQPGADPALASAQPSLWTPPAEHPPGVWTS